jgi:hypothetical protein
MRSITAAGSSAEMRSITAAGERLLKEPEGVVELLD